MTGLCKNVQTCLLQRGIVSKKRLFFIFLGILRVVEERWEEQKNENTICERKFAF